MRVRRKFGFMLISTVWLASSCTLFDDSAQKKTLASNFIATPVSYYSTQKARYLGTTYKKNLERLATRITEDPKTAPLQFANNISSVGGIGFFTHSATKTPDERYLEVVLATPETFETKDRYSEKVAQLFARYGTELLKILTSDKEIYQDKEFSGYGLNLAWRNVVVDGAGKHVAMARAVAYFHKERALNFLHQEINANDLLAKAVIFAVEEDGPLRLVSYQPQQVRPDYQPAIREDNLAEAPQGSKPTQLTDSSKPLAEVKPKVEPRTEAAQRAPATPESSSAQTQKPNTESEAGVRTKAPELSAKAAPPEQVSSMPIDSSVIAPKAPTSEVLRNDEKEEVHPVQSESAEAKPAVAEVKDHAVATAVVKKSEETPPATAEPKANQANAERVVASPAKNKPLISTDEREKAIPAAPVAKVGSGEGSIKPPAAVISEVAKVPPVESSAAPFPAPKPAPVIPEPVAPKQPSQGDTRVSVTESQEMPKAAVPAKSPKAEETVISTVAKSAAKPPEQVASVKMTEVPPVTSVAKSEPPSNKPVSAGSPVSARAKPIVAPVPEQLAALKKPQEAANDQRALTHPAPKPLEGFVIQIAFNDKEKAQSWAEKMEQRGYAVSVTEAGSEGSLRVRLGNFVVRDEAERQLNSLKHDGIKGIIINLPQAFRPEARSSLP